MNKLLSGVVAASMLLGATAQAVTWNSDYGVITDLTPDHIAWLDEHRANVDSGVLAGFLWTRVDGNYITTPVDMIREAPTKEAAKTIVINNIVETVIIEEVEVIRERIVVDNAEIDRLNGVIDGLNTTISNLEDTIDSNSIASQMAIAAIQSQLNTKVTELASMTAERDALLFNINGPRGLNERIRDLGLDVAQERAAKIAYRDAFNEINASQSSILLSMARAAGVTVDFVNGQIITNDPHGFLVAQNNFLNNNGPAQALVDAIIANVPMPTLNFGTITSDPLSDSNLDNYNPTPNNTGVNVWKNGNGVDRDVFIWNGSRSIFLGLSGGINRDARRILNETIQQVYDSGYNNGYDAGYVDGYRDGFTDGQSSVTIQ